MTATRVHKQDLDPAVLGLPLGLTGAVIATRFVGGVTSVAPTTGTFAVGDFVISAAGGIFVCTTAGSPGVWVAVTGGGGVTIGSALPLIEAGSGAVGTAPDVSHEDHVHPAFGGGGGGSAQSFVGYDVIGGTWTTLTADRYYVKQIVLAADATFTSIDAYLRPSTDGGPSSLRAVILSDVTGAPSLLLAGTEIEIPYLSNSASMPGDGRWMSLPIGAHLLAGTYWIGVAVGTNGSYFDMANDGSGTDVTFTPSGDYVTGAYPSVWTLTTGSVKWSIRASILTGAGGAGSLYLSGVDVPPPAPNAQDAEFASADLSAWTVLVGSGSDTPVTFDADTTIKGAAYLKGNTGGQVGAWKAWTPADGDTVVLKVTDAKFSAGNYHRAAQLWISTAAPGAMTVISAVQDSSGPHIAVNTYSGIGAYSGAPGAVGTAFDLMGGPLFFKIVRNSSTSYDFLWSKGGLVWSPIVLAVNPGFTVGSIGFGVESSGSGVTPEAVFDWMRFNWVGGADAVVFSGGGGGTNAPDGKPWNFTPNSSPDAIDDEFGDASSQSGPVNGLDGKWSKHNMGTSGWLVLDDTRAPGCVLFDLPTGEATAQHIYESFAPAGDFVVACRMMLSNLGDRQMWYLNLLDTSGNGIGIGIDTGDTVRMREISGWEQTGTNWDLGLGGFSNAELYGGLPFVFFLKRVEGVYLGAVTFNDRILAPRFVASTPSAFTLAYVSFGRVYGGNTSYCALDFVRRVALHDPPLLVLPLDPTYGDDMTANPIDSRWTKAGTTPMAVVTDGIKYALTAAAQTDRMTQPFTDTGQDFEILTHVTALSDAGGMTGIVCADASGNGTAFSAYNDSTAYLWNMTAWDYAGTGAGIAITAPALLDCWLSLKRVGTTWTARWTNDSGATWHVTGTRSDATTITRIGVARIFTSGGTITGQLHKFNYATPDFGI